MNAAQITKYHTLKSQWIKVRQAAGRPHDQAALDRLQYNTIGRVSSSKLFSQRDLDRMLGAFLAEIYPADLNRQMAQNDQEENRRTGLRQACDLVCSQMWSDGGDRRMMDENFRDAYVRGTARRVIKKELLDCDTAELGRVLGCLSARLVRLKAACAERIAAARAGRPLPADVKVDEAWPSEEAVRTAPKPADDDGFPF